MSDPAKLREALDGNFPEGWGPSQAHDIIIVAARRQLALEPGECPDEECVQGYLDAERSVIHETCHGRGWLYKPEVIESLTAALRADWDCPPYFPWDQLPESAKTHLLARTEATVMAVLDALRSLDQEAPR